MEGNVVRSALMVARCTTAKNHVPLPNKSAFGTKAKSTDVRSHVSFQG